MLGYIVHFSGSMSTPNAILCFTGLLGLDSRRQLFQVGSKRVAAVTCQDSWATWVSWLWCWISWVAEALGLSQATLVSWLQSGDSRTWFCWEWCARESKWLQHPERVSETRCVFLLGILDFLCLFLYMYDIFTISNICVCFCWLSSASISSGNLSFFP